MTVNAAEIMVGVLAVGLAVVLAWGDILRLLEARRERVAGPDEASSGQ